MTETLFPETRLQQIHSRDGSSTKAIAVIPGKSNSVHIRDITLPDIGGTEVLFKAELVGLDGTDREINEGLYGEAPKGEDFFVIAHGSLGIVEETGSSSVAPHSMMVVGNNGVVVLTSITGGGKKMEICSDCFNQGRVLGNRTVVGSVNAHRRDFYQGIKDLLDIQERWPFILENFITARYPPEKISEAFEKMESNIKVVIDFGGD